MTVRFALTYGGLAAAAIAIATAWFVFAADSTRATLLFFAAACAAAGQLGASLYTARILDLTIRLNAEAAGKQSAKDAEDRQQRLDEAAARFGERWTDATMFYARKQFDEILEYKGDPNKVEELIKQSKDKETNVKNVLNFLEQLSLCVLKAQCNESVARDLFGGIVINIWHATENWVKFQRAHRGRPSAMGATRSSICALEMNCYTM